MKLDKSSFTTGQVAELCEVSQRTVINWIERGQLDAHKLPGRGDRRITRVDLKSFFIRNAIPLPDELEASVVKVLVVDDDPNMCAALERLLKLEGYSVMVAHDGFEAGLLLAQQRPTLMTLDLNMPGVNGWQLLQRLQSKPTGELRVLVLSAGGSEDLNRALVLGADVVMAKPFENEVFLEKVEELVKRGG